MGKDCINRSEEEEIDEEVMTDEVMFYSYFGEDPNFYEEEENRYVGYLMLLLLGLEDDIIEADLLNYFRKFVDSSRDCDWVTISRHPETKESCGYAIMQLANSSARNYVIDQKHKIKSSWVTALPTMPTPWLTPWLHSPIKPEIPEDKGKTFSTQCILHTGPRTIYVGGFTSQLEDVDAYTIGNYFSQYGTVEAVELPLRMQRRYRPEDKITPTPYSYGWALVLFALSDSVDDVLAKSRHYIDGVLVVVYPTDDAKLKYPPMPEDDTEYKNETGHSSKKLKLQEDKTRI